MKQSNMLSIRTERAIIGGLLLLGLILLAAALWQPKEAEPVGWTEMSEQVEQTVTAIEQAKAEREQGQGQEQGQELRGKQARGDDLSQGAGQKWGNKAGGSAAAARSSEGNGSGQGPADSAGRIDINAATAEELDTLPGIGAAKAQAIVNEREKNGRFRSVEDLLRVKGIGPKLLEKMKSSIVAKQ